MISRRDRFMKIVGIVLSYPRKSCTDEVSEGNQGLICHMPYSSSIDDRVVQLFREL